MKKIIVAFIFGIMVFTSCFAQATPDPTPTASGVAVGGTGQRDTECPGVSDLVCGGDGQDPCPRAEATPARPADDANTIEADSPTRTP